MEEDSITIKEIIKRPMEDQNLKKKLKRILKKYVYTIILYISRGISRFTYLPNVWEFILHIFTSKLDNLELVKFLVKASFCKFAF